MDTIRDRVSGEKGGLTVKVTGAAGYGADAIKVFGNINGTLLGVDRADRPDPAGHHLPLADLLGDPVLHGAARRVAPRAASAT